MWGINYMVIKFQLIRVLYMIGACIPPADFDYFTRDTKKYINIFSYFLRKYL